MLIPPRLGRPLMAIWISLGLHAALLAFVHVAPPGATMGASVIEARLVPRVSVAQVVQPNAALAAEADDDAPRAPLVPVEVAKALPATQAPDTVDAPPPGAAAAQPLPAATMPPGLAIPSGVDLNFYPARELDVQPRALHAILPEYPPEADRQHLSGKVLLQIRLEADGRVSDLGIVDADPPGLFDDSALKVFRAARFAPAQKDGRAVRALLLIEVKYDWEGDGEAVSGEAVKR